MRRKQRLKRETDAAEVTADVPAVEEIVEEEAPEQSLEESKWQNLVMANVEEDMNIRTAPDESAELAGKFYRGDVAEVVSVEGEWTQISSGNVTGYVKNDYLVYGMEASELANEVCSIYATVNTDGLRLRSEPSEEAEVVTTASSGDKLKVDKDAAADEGWVAVHTSDATAYVSAEYVGVELNLGTALNSEEVAAKEAEEAEEKAAESAKKPAASANADEVTLLGALIQCEAGNGSYEGMVAVGAVVMNRVRSGAYPEAFPASFIRADNSAGIERKRCKRYGKRRPERMLTGGERSNLRRGQYERSSFFPQRGKRICGNRNRSECIFLVVIRNKL